MCFLGVVSTIIVVMRCRELGKCVRSFLPSFCRSSSIVSSCAERKKKKKKLSVGRSVDIYRRCAALRSRKSLMGVLLESLFFAPPPARNKKVCGQRCNTAIWAKQQQQNRPRKGKSYESYSLHDRSRSFFCPLNSSFARHRLENGHVYDGI